MSFAEQERALFDLLFDSELRSRFTREGVGALASYDLQEDEQADFVTIRPDALELDAKMRRDFLLAHLCRAFPLSFAMTSSLQSGMTGLKALVDTETMRASPVARASVYGKRLRDYLSGSEEIKQDEKPLVISIVEAELGMAWTAAALKDEVIAGSSPASEDEAVPDDWAIQPMRLADFVSASIIPQSYGALKKLLCQGPDTELWNSLKQVPLSRNQRRTALSSEAPRLLVMRAVTSHVSSCEPVIEHKTVELSDGFAPLLQHINGQTSVENLLQQFRQAGASEQMAEGVRQGFRQLVDNGMLQVAA